MDGIQRRPGKLVRDPADTGRRVTNPPRDGIPPYIRSTELPNTFMNFGTIYMRAARFFVDTDILLLFHRLAESRNSATLNTGCPYYGRPARAV